MSARRILVAGIGNILVGDDGFGVEVARRIAREPLPPNVMVRDFGICGMDLVFALLDGFDAAILVDVTQRGEPPGTLYVLDLDNDHASGEEQPPQIAGHEMDPARVLQLVKWMGGGVTCLRLVGCEPETFGDDDEVVCGLSESVASAVTPAVVRVCSLIDALNESARSHA